MRSCPRDDCGRELDERQRAKVLPNLRDRSITLLSGKGTFAAAPREGGDDLDLGESRSGGEPCFQQRSNRVAARLFDVALHERARVEVDDQIRSSRSSRMASLRGAPRPAIAEKGARAVVVSRATTARSASSWRRCDKSSTAMGRGRSSATGSPRSVTTRVAPRRTCRRYVPRRVLSSRAPTYLRRRMWSL